MLMCCGKVSFSFLVLLVGGGFRSHSWSANITGSKEWLLLPPKQEELLRDKLGNLPFDLRTHTTTDMDSSIAPCPIRVIQHAGEVIFVPRWAIITNAAAASSLCVRVQWLAPSGAQP